MQLGRLSRFTFAGVLATLLAGCASLDSEQLRICRLVLPGLHAEGTEIREMRAGRAALGQQGIRIEYSAHEPSEVRAPHWVHCGFAGTAFERGRAELIAVETDRGVLGDARLFYLKRFWLAAPAPAEGGTLEEVHEISAPLAYALQQFFNATVFCSIYALLAAAYALIYGLVGRLNLAFGEIALMGAFGTVTGIAVFLAVGFTEPIAALAFAALIAAFLASAWSWLAGKFVIAPLHERHTTSQPILVATVGLAVALQEFLRIFQGVREHWIPPFFNTPIAITRAGRFVVTVTPIQIVIVALALGAACGLLWLLARTSFGRAWRAFSDDPGAAELFGIATGRLLASTFLLAGMMSGLAGWIVAVYYGNVSFAMGTTLGLKALLAAVVGGIGSVPGAFLGGLLVGAIEAIWSAYFDISLRDIVVYVILAVILVLRPGGLLGFAGPSPREA